MIVALIGMLFILSSCSLFEMPPDKRPVPVGKYELWVVKDNVLPQGWNGAAIVERQPCLIIIRHQSELRDRRFYDVLKHEAAHCHGWTHGLQLELRLPE